MLKNIFNGDNPFFQIIGKLTDMLALSLLFVLCSLPIVTLGPAAAALYDSTRHCVRGEESGAYARFFRTFGNEWKTGALTTLVWAGIWGVLFLMYGIVSTGANAGVKLMLALKYAYLTLGCIPAGICCWLFPLLSRFTLSFGQLNRAAARIAVARLPRTLCCVAVAAGCVAACALWLLPLICLPCVMMLAFSYFMEPVMEKLAGEQAPDREECRHGGGNRQSGGEENLGEERMENETKRKE